MKTATLATEENVITLTVEPKPARLIRQSETRFKIIPFTNRGGTQAWRVAGVKRTGERVRVNFADEDTAKKKRSELEAEFYARADGDAALKLTTLSDAQLRLAQVAFIRLDADEDLLPAVEYWLKHGKQQSVAQTVRIDEAVTEFKAWLVKQPENELSHRTKKNLRLRVDLFANSIGNLELASITPETIKSFLEKREVTTRTRINDRLVLSRFFAWCRGKGWVAINAARKEEKSKRLPRPAPAILTMEEAGRLLRAAEKHKRGRLAPYVAVCLFGGLRPFEAARLQLSQINLEDGEIRLESNQTKTRRSRVVKILPTLAAWLKAYPRKPIFPPNWRKDFDTVKLSAGFGTPTDEKPKLKPWVEDVMRHTAISHYFRQTGSYGLTAEWAGNSEEIIKNHYQGRVSTEDTKAFYALMPKKGGRK